MKSRSVPCASTSTKILPGSRGTRENLSLSCSNLPRQSVAISTQGLVAYGLPNGSGDIVVVCLSSAQIVQTLTGHGHSVTALLWQPPHVSHLHHGLRLYSADERGMVVMWDVTEGIMERCVDISKRTSSAVVALALCNQRQVLMVLARDNTSLFFDANFSDPRPIAGAGLPSAGSTTGGERLSFGPSRFAQCLMDPKSACAIAIGDRIRVISSIDTLVPSASSRRELKEGAPQVSMTSGGSSAPWARDIIFDSNDGTETVVDVCFSEAMPEVLFLASRSWVSMYDWKLNMMLEEQIVWQKQGVEFLTLFPVSPNHMDEEGTELPLIYSFCTDDRLSAWYLKQSPNLHSGGGPPSLSTSQQSAPNFVFVSADVRGARIMSKHVANVAQSPMASNEFAVVFVDGSVAHWRFITEERCWSLVSYLDCPVVRPVSFCSIETTESISAIGALPREQQQCSNAMENPSNKFGDRVLKQNLVVTALESGDVVVLDPLFNRAVRKYSVVHAGTTRIVLVRPYHDHLFWIATNRTVNQKNVLQISLLSARTGMLQYVLREPPAVAEAASLVSMSMDSTQTFLLVVFSSGNFEVWNCDQRSLVHVHNGSGIVSAAWGPQACLFDLSYGPFQLVVAIMDEGGAQLYRVSTDRVTRLKESLPLRIASAMSSNTATLVCGAGDALVCIDNITGASVVRGMGGSTRWAPLPQFPRNASAVSAAALQSKSPSGADSLLLAVCFEDGHFGVWDLQTTKRIGFSKSLQLSSNAVDVQWHRAAASSSQGLYLAVLLSSGSLLIVEKECDCVNSSFVSKCLRAPIESVSFLLPAHSTYIQTLWEMHPIARVQRALVPDEVTTGAASLRLSQSSLHAMTMSTSFLVQNIAQPLPCRGPYGQVITPSLLTQLDELKLYAETIVPKRIQLQLAVAADKKSLETAAFIVATFFGQSEKRHFWALVNEFRSTWLKHEDAKFSFCKSIEADEGDLDDDDSFLQRHNRTDILERTNGCEGAIGPMHPVFAADSFSEAIAPKRVLETNRSTLNSLRVNALQGFRSRNIDDALQRLATSRELLALGDPHGAYELLIDSNTELDSFGAHATLAIAIAAAVHHPVPPSVLLTAKRAAAMLLAKGDFESAAEKFCMIGEHYEACLALQSRGEWNAASLIARLAPMTESCRSELLHRWANFAVQRGKPMTAARMLLGLQSPRQALVLLADCSQLTDVAGLFAVALAREYSLLSEECLQARMASPLRKSDNVEDQETLREILLSLLRDYENLLKSVGNICSQKLVAELVERLSLATAEESF